MTYDKPMCRNCRHWEESDWHWGRCSLLSYTTEPGASITIRVGASGPQDVYTQGVFACNKWQYPLDPVDGKPTVQEKVNAYLAARDAAIERIKADQG